MLQPVTIDPKMVNDPKYTLLAKALRIHRDRAIMAMVRVISWCTHNQLLHIDQPTVDALADIPHFFRTAVDVQLIIPDGKRHTILNLSRYTKWYAGIKTKAMIGVEVRKRKRLEKHSLKKIESDLQVNQQVHPQVYLEHNPQDNLAVYPSVSTYKNKEKEPDLGFSSSIGQNTPTEMVALPELPSAPTGTVADWSLVKDQIFADWGVTLKHFNVMLDPSWDDHALLRLFVRYGRERLRLAMIGVCHEEAFPGFDPHKAFSVNRFGGPICFERFVKRGSQIEFEAAQKKKPRPRPDLPSDDLPSKPKLIEQLPNGHDFDYPDQDEIKKRVAEIRSKMQTPSPDLPPEDPDHG